MSPSAMKNHGIREVLIYQSIFLRWVGYEPEIRDENSSHDNPTVCGNENNYKLVCPQVFPGSV